MFLIHQVFLQSYTPDFSSSQTAVAEKLALVDLDGLRLAPSMLQNIPAAQFLTNYNIPTFLQMKTLYGQINQSSSHATSFLANSQTNKTSYSFSRLQDGSLYMKSHQSLIASPTTPSSLTNIFFYPSIVHQYQGQTYHYMGHAYSAQLPRYAIDYLKFFQALPASGMNQILDLCNKNSATDANVKERLCHIDYLKDSSVVNSATFNQFIQVYFPNGQFVNTDLEISYQELKVLVPEIWFGQLCDGSSSPRDMALITYNFPYLSWTGRPALMIYYDLSKQTIAVQVSMALFSGRRSQGLDQLESPQDFFSVTTPLNLNYFIDVSTDQVTYQIGGKGVATAQHELSSLEPDPVINSNNPSSGNANWSAGADDSFIRSDVLPTIKRTSGQDTSISDRIYSVSLDGLRSGTGAVNSAGARELLRDFHIPSVADLLEMRGEVNASIQSTSATQFSSANNTQYKVGHLADNSYFLRSTQTVNGRKLTNTTFYPTIFNTFSGGLVRYAGYASSNYLPTSSIGYLSLLQALPSSKMAEVQDWIALNPLFGSSSRERYIDLGNLPDNQSFQDFKANNFTDGQYASLDANLLYQQSKVISTSLWFGELLNADNTVKRVALITYNAAFMCWSGEPVAMILYDLDDETISIQVSIAFFCGKKIAQEGAIAWPNPLAGDSLFSCGGVPTLLKITYFLDTKKNELSYRIGGKGVALPEYELSSVAHSSSSLPALSTSPLAITFAPLINQGLHPFTGFFLSMVHILEEYSFFNEWDGINKAYVQSPDIFAWKYDIPTLKYVQKNIPAPSILLYGITSRADVLSALGIYDIAEAKTFINDVIAGANFTSSAFYSGEIAYFSDKFLSMAYRGQSLTTGGIAPKGSGQLMEAGSAMSSGETIVVVAGNIKLPLDSALTNDGLNPYNLNGVEDYGLINRVVVDDQGHHIQKYYTVLNNNIPVALNRSGSGVTVTYSDNITYSMFVAEPDDLSHTLTQYYKMVEYRYVISSNNLSISRVVDGASVLLRTQPLI